MTGPSGDSLPRHGAPDPEVRPTLRRALLGAAPAAALAVPVVAQTSKPEVRWRLASSFPSTLDVLFGTAEGIARRVAQLTEGRFHIRASPAGEIVSALQVLDAVQVGAVECGHTPTYYYMGKDPSFAFFTALPFGLNARQMTAWLRYGGGNELAAELLADYGVIGFPAGDTGAQMGGWFRHEVRGLRDLAGLQIRLAGFAGRVFRRLGAVPVELAAPEIVPALERSLIDAAEWVGPHDDERLGFARVARFRYHYYAPGFCEPGARAHLMVNRRAYDQLPDQYRHALEVACAEQDGEMLSRYDHLNPQALRRLVAAGAQLRFWPGEVMQAAWRAAHELYDEAAAQNARFKTIWESYRRYRGDEYQWFRVAENSFDNFAFAAAAAAPAGR